MSFLVISKILTVFVNTLTADDKYSLCNSEKIQQPTEMQLTKKQKTFSQFFGSFLKSTSNFEHFGQKKTVMTCLFWKSRNAKDGVR